MEKNSDREVSELLKQLEEFVEKDQASKNIKPQSNVKPSDLSVEELLDQLTQRIGDGVTVEEQNAVSEYDISDSIDEFIVTEVEEGENVEEETSAYDNIADVLESVGTERLETFTDECVAQTLEVFEDSHLQQEGRVADVTGISAIEEEAQESTCEDASCTEENDMETSFSAIIEYGFVSNETKAEDCMEDIDLGAEMFSVDSESTSGPHEETVKESSLQEEALRKQVEAFVLETLNPEEESSILDSIAVLAAKKKEDEDENAACEDAISVTEESYGAPEQEELPCDYVSNGMMARFFGRETLSTRDSGDDSSDFDYKEFSDTDLNLVLKLGCEEELHETFGFSRVRAAKNGFHDPAEETAIGSSVLTSREKEFRSYEQTEDIKSRYRKEKKQLYRRFAFTFALTVFILFFEHIFITDIVIPYVSDFFAVPWRYYAVSILLTLLCVFCSAKRLFGGCAAIFVMTPHPYTPPAVFAFLNLLYEVIVLTVYPEKGLLTYNFVLAIFMLFAIANEYMRLIRESVTFDVVSDGKPKLSLERFEGEGELKKDGSYLGRHDFFVEKISFVGNYFSRIGKIPMHQRIYGFALILIILCGVAMMLLSAHISKDLGNAFQTFFFWMMLCVPMQYLVLGSYPFYLLSKGLKKVDSAILGEVVVDEYATTDMIYLGDDEMFGRHGASVVGLRLYGEMDFYKLLYYAFAVFSNLGAPLCHIFDTSTKEIPKPQEVKINTVSAGGIEATVDCEHKVIVGNIAFIRSKGFFPKRNLDDEKKVESGQTSIVYIAVDGALCAKLYIKYTITKRFEKFLEEMVSNGISVGIRSLDPSVNARMISILREHREPEISVIHPTANELVAIGKHSDSGIVTGRNSHMIFRILQQCLHIRGVLKKQAIFYFISILLGVGSVVALMLTDRFGAIPSLVVAVYHIIWLIVGVIYTKSKLK